MNRTTLFNNKEILMDERPFFIREWFAKGIISIKDLLQENGQFLTYEEVTRKYSCKTNFLNFYHMSPDTPANTWPVYQSILSQYGECQLLVEYQLTVDHPAGAYQSTVV